MASTRMRPQSLFSSKWLVLIFALAQFLHAQATNGTVSGTVFDSASGRPISGAAIAVNGQLDTRNVTDPDGKFSMSLSPGTYILKFTAANYSPVEVTDVVVKAGEVTEASTLL